MCKVLGVLTGFQEPGLCLKDCINMTCHIHVHGDMILQLHGDLLNLGFSHQAFVSGDTELTCKNLESESSELSCVWDSGEVKNLPEFVVAGATRAWHQRMRFIARSIRLGYNILQIDGDTVFFR